MRGQNVAFYELPHNCQWSDLPLLLPFRLRQQFIIPIFARQPMLGQNVGGTDQALVRLMLPSIARQLLPHLYNAPNAYNVHLRAKTWWPCFPSTSPLHQRKRAKSMFDGFTFSYGFLFSCIAGSRATLCTDQKHKIDSPIKIEKKPVLQFQTEAPVQAASQSKHQPKLALKDPNDVSSKSSAMPSYLLPLRS